MRVRKDLIGFIAVIQSVLFLTHYLLYETWTFSPAGSETPGAFWIKLVLGLLSVSFVAASLLAFRYTNAALRAFYRAAAVWMGLLTFLFLAAVSSWIIFGVARLAGLDVNFHRTVELLFGAAAVAGLYGVFNASWTRITRTTVRLANLPAAWRGRTAALISDVHLGHVRNGSFLRRMVAKILREEPDAIFIAGDLYDGTAIDARRAAEPLNELMAPQGVYFVAGNHEQFGDDSKYLNAIAAAGVRVLSNEKVEVDGLQIIGVPYRNATQHGQLASVLHGDRLGSRPREHSVDACARPSGDRGGCRRFPAAIRAYAPWAVHTLELDGAADLPAVCVWPKPDREDAGFHFERSRNLGTAAAAGIESRDCGARVPMKLRNSQLARCRGAPFLASFARSGLRVEIHRSL